MEKTFNILITHFDVIPSKDGLTNVIKKAHWKVDCLYEGKYYYKTGSYTLPPASDTDFTAFENLTKDQVIGWLSGPINFNIVKNELSEEIDESLYPTVNLQLPFEN
jgi:hypothetical protein